jgi:serine/threonine-protein kinase SRPK3
MYIYAHLAAVNQSHIGSNYIRNVLDRFVITVNQGFYPCIVHKPGAASLCQIRCMYPDKRLPPQSIKDVLKCIIPALDFLHRIAGVVHTGTFLLFPFPLYPFVLY